MTRGVRTEETMKMPTKNRSAWRTVAVLTVLAFGTVGVTPALAEEPSPTATAEVTPSAEATATEPATDAPEATETATSVPSDTATAEAESPAPAGEDSQPPAAEESDAADPMPVTQTIERTAVAVKAETVRLLYAVHKPVTLRGITLSYDGAVDTEPYLTSVGYGLIYSGWNRQVSDDAEHTAVVTAGLVDTGTLTPYSVRYTSTIKRWGDSIGVTTTCEIVRDGEAVDDIGEDSPFWCEDTIAQSASGFVDSRSVVALNPWAEISGTIDVRNLGGKNVPLISLHDGIISTRNQDRRVIMNGKEWYPFDANGVPVMEPKYSTISNGEHLTFSAAALGNTEKQSDDDAHAWGSFSYEVMLGGKTTGYWVVGTVENYKWNSLWYPQATCDFYMGDPNEAGSKVETQLPFTCEPTGMTWGNVNSADDTTFQIRMAAVDTLAKSQDAISVGVKEACNTGTPDACVITAGGRSRMQKPATGLGDGSSQGNESGKTTTLDFVLAASKETTNSFEQMFGITVGIEEKETFFGSGITSKLEMTSETSFGYDVTRGFKMQQETGADVPPWAVGSFTYADTVDVYDAEIYFIGHDGHWYRFSGGRIEVPIPSQQPTLPEEGSSLPPIVEPKGGHIKGVEYSCAWMPDKPDKVITAVIAEYDLLHQVAKDDRSVQHYADDLVGCAIPPSWDKLTLSDFTGGERKLKFEVLQTALHPETEE